jgi:hypothetical protein
MITPVNRLFDYISSHMRVTSEYLVKCALPIKKTVECAVTVGSIYVQPLPLHRRDGGHLMRTHTFFKTTIFAGLLLVSSAAAADTTITGTYTMVDYNGNSGVITTFAGAGMYTFLYNDTSTPLASVQGETRSAYNSVCGQYADAWDNAVRQGSPYGTYVNLLGKMADARCDSQITTAIPTNPFAPVIYLAPVRH